MISCAVAKSRFSHETTQMDIVATSLESVSLQFLNGLVEFFHFSLKRNESMKSLACEERFKPLAICSCTFVWVEALHPSQ